MSDSSNKNKSLRKKNALTCAYFAFLLLMTIVIFLVTEGVHFFPPGKHFLINKSSEFERMLRYRGDAGPSPPAAGHTSLQTRAHGAAGGAAADHTQGCSEE